MIHKFPMFIITLLNIDDYKSCFMCVSMVAGFRPSQL